MVQVRPGGVPVLFADFSATKVHAREFYFGNPKVLVNILLLLPLCITAANTT